MSEVRIPSQSAQTTKLLLESKRPEISEIELTLFENCNIVCDFCFHDKKSQVGLSKEEMFSKIPIMDEFLSRQQNRVKIAQINVVGGELFQDRWMERLNQDYYELLIETKKSFDKYNLKMKVVFVSNFLFKKKESVKELIDKLRDYGIDTHLIVSYDFEGRPLSKSYWDNVTYFGPEYICSVNLVGTSGSIKKFIENKDNNFKYFYKNFNIFFDDFIPDNGSDDLIPSDREFSQWYKYIADNFPLIQPVADLINNQNNSMHCLSLNKVTIFPDNKTSNCRWHRYKQTDFNTKLNLKDNSGMMQNFIDEMGCLQCEYFSRCGFRCFTQWDWKNRKRDMEICPMKLFFNHIEGKQD